jgi:hypothetical protein
MKRALTILGLALMAALLDGGARPERAQCAFCYNGTCWNSSICGRSCVCMKRGMDTSGSCFSASALPEGYTRLE